MKQYWTLFVFGVLIFFLPFLGFPPSWKTAFFFIAGLVISVLALSFIIKERATEREKTVAHQHVGNYEK